MLVSLKNLKNITDNPIVDISSSVCVGSVERHYQTAPDLKLWLFLFHEPNLIKIKRTELELF